MPENEEQKPDGITKPLKMAVVYDLNTGSVQVSIPKDIGHAYVLLKMLMDAVFKSAMNPEPDRMVKTPDELGMRRGTRIALG